MPVRLRHEGVLDSSGIAEEPNDVKVRFKTSDSLFKVPSKSSLRFSLINLSVKSALNQ